MKETRFRDTEIGLVPEEWEMISLGDVGEVRMCKRIMKFQTAEKGDIPFFKISTLGGRPDAFISRILYESYKEKYSYPKRGDILLSAAGTIGRAVIFDGEPSYFQDSNIVWIENTESLLLNNLLYYIYRDLSWVTESGTIPRIYNSIVRSINFPIPINKEEQSRIAAALTSVDDLISALDKLIEKKKNIKQGSMQLLLTGKKRLKGFTDPWVEKKMGTIEIQNGAMLNSTEYKAGNIPVIAGGKQPAGYHSSSNRLANTITISASGANAGYISFYKGPIFASDCSTINEQKGISIEFLYYCLLLRQNAIYKCQTGGAQPHIHAKDIKDIGFAMPSDISEQKRIASIIESMDEEISSLETKKAKYEQIKQGMMQQLLTGKIRLIEGPA
ncbi:MAG: restriction endonuclease subunit S [Porphyromonadaceae bacterium]|uniref:restriction endonuclease subunit S n=1 Tax=uncultured Porphyromonas sp. TaxID=159274 RepID=UPI001CB2F58F|nr:restriction endonuclease subunit S [uncultured Porphyromonas sp.]MBF1373697.1 restriction endonuclease subunit S [Porphyromonadaceae bacterium]